MFYRPGADVGSCVEMAEVVGTEVVVETVKGADFEVVAAAGYMLTVARSLTPFARASRRLAPVRITTSSHTKTPFSPVRLPSDRPPINNSTSDIFENTLIVWRRPVRISSREPAMWTKGSALFQLAL